jgi:glucosamine--fructose-6-phosphate aminotransferase (isomerizing)
MNQDLIATVARHAAYSVGHTSRLIGKLRSRFSRLPSIHWGRHTATVNGPAVILFPCSANRLCCGLAGIIAVKGRTGRKMAIDLPALVTRVDTIAAAGLETHSPQIDAIEGGYLGGQATLDTLLAEIRALKQEAPFLCLFNDPAAQQTIADLSARLSILLEGEQAQLSQRVGSMASRAVDVISRRIETLKDIVWCLDMELAGNIDKVQDLIADEGHP